MNDHLIKTLNAEMEELKSSIGELERQKASLTDHVQVLQEKLAAALADATSFNRTTSI